MYRIWADSKAIKNNIIAGLAAEPCIAVEKDGKRVGSITEAKILGPSRVCYSFGDWPQVWIETESDVEFS